MIKIADGIFIKSSSTLKGIVARMIRGAESRGADYYPPSRLLGGKPSTAFVDLPGEMPYPAAQRTVYQWDRLRDRLGKRFGWGKMEKAVPRLSTPDWGHGGLIYPGD